MQFVYGILLTIISILVLIYFKYLKKPSKFKHIPSPSLIECIKNDFEDKPQDQKINELITQRNKKEKIQAVWRNGRWDVVVSSVKAAKMIYTDTTTFIKEIPIEDRPDLLSGKFMGVNLVFSNGDTWKAQRRILNPPFKKQFDVKLFSDCVEQFFNVIDNRFNGKHIEIYRNMQRITMDALGKGIMGVNFDSIVNNDIPFIKAYNNLIAASTNPFYFVVETLDTPLNPMRKPAYDDLKLLETHFHAILEEKKANLNLNEDGDNVNEDILSLMLKANLQEDDQFTDKEIRDNIMVFLLAGHDTTAFALSAALHFLAQHQDVQQKLRQHIMDVMQIKDLKDGEIKCPTLEQTKEMDYLLAVIKETMRLYPSVPGLPLRKTTKEVEIEGYRIPKDSTILLSIYSMHHDEDNFVEAEKFIPERFIKDSPYYQNDQDSGSWGPFGGGKRSCLGMKFSLLEQKIVLSMILLRYNVNYDKHAPQNNGQGLSLGPSTLFTPKDYYLNFNLL